MLHTSCNAELQIRQAGSNLINWVLVILFHTHAALLFPPCHKQFTFMTFFTISYGCTMKSELESRTKAHFCFSNGRASYT